MYISAISKKHPKKITIDECMAVVKFCANEFFSDNLQKKLYIFLDFDSLKDGDISDGVCGILEENIKGPRIFYIGLQSKIPRLDSINTICHEMVHLKQYAFGELKIRGNEKSPIFKWNGKVYKFKHEINAKMPTAKKLTKAEVAAYYELPWEKEAYKKQTSLVKKYLKTL